MIVDNQHGPGHMRTLAPMRSPGGIRVHPVPSCHTSRAKTSFERQPALGREDEAVVALLEQSGVRCPRRDVVERRAGRSVRCNPAVGSESQDQSL